MKFFPILLLIALTANAPADELPKKAPVTRYTGLWTNSPFTTKPPPKAAGEEPNPLEDYALGGISPISGGHRITLLNRKNPEERITIDPNDQSYKILAINRLAGDPMGTSVRLSTGGKEGTVAFDKTLLVLKAAPVPQVQQPNNPGIPQNPNANGQQPGGEIPRQPRPRVVTPNPGANGVPTNPNIPQPQVRNPNIPQNLPRPNNPVQQQLQQQQRPIRR